MTAMAASTSVRGSRPGDPSAVTVEGGSARPALASCPNGVLAEQLFVADYPKLARWTLNTLSTEQHP